MQLSFTLLDTEHTEVYLYATLFCSTCGAEVEEL